MADNNDEDKGIEPDAIKIKCQDHCQKEGVNLYENGQHFGDKYDTGNSEPTFKANIGCNVERKPLYGAETILWLWKDDFKKSILGEVDELRERGVAEDVAEQLEHTVKRFEEVFSDEQ